MRLRKRSVSARWVSLFLALEPKKGIIRPERLRPIRFLADNSIMNEQLKAILESVGVSVSPSDNILQSFEDWLGYNDDPNYQGTTVEDSAPLSSETYQLIQAWIQSVWDPKDISALQENPFLAANLNPQDMSLRLVLDPVRATQWLVYWMDLNLDQDDATDGAGAMQTQEKGLLVQLLQSSNTTVISALYHYIQNLPVLQAQMHSYTQQLQKAHAPTSKTATTTQLSNPQTRLQQYALAQSVAQRFQSEWDQHVVDLEKICGQMYLLSNVSQRKFTRRMLGQVWTQYVYASSSGAGLRQENTRAAGIRLTLQVLYRLLLGVPNILDSHEQLLMQLLVPLHKPDAMVLWRDQVSVLELYHEPLVKCMAVILQKKRSLITSTIEQLLSSEVFPLAGNTPKQVLLLHEIDTYLGLLSDEGESISAMWSTSLLVVLKRCMTSEHSRIAERALEFFKNTSFKRIIAQHYKGSLEILLPALVTQKPSWNPTVRKMTYHVLKEIELMNPKVFEQVANQLFAHRAGSSERFISETKPKPTSHILPTGPKPATVSDTSLKTGMGTWKPPKQTSSTMSPPADRVPGRGKAPWTNSAGQPPLTVTGVAPWAVKPQESNSSDPLKNQRATTTVKVGAETANESCPKVPTTGYEYVKQWMDMLKPPEEDIGSSSWSKAQMAETPTLLPDLKFHDLVFGHDLGSGAFGQVRYARLIDKTKTRSHWPEYAVKIISTEKIRELGYETSVQREIAVLRILSHPGIARLVSSFRFQDGAYLVLEYASKGDLHTLLRKHGSLDAQSTRFVAGSVVAALASIHDMGLVYGDLKAENVLIMETGHVKITDFGGCRPVSKEAREMISSIAKGLLKNLRDGDWRTKDGDGSSESALFEADDSNLDHEDDRIEGTTSYLPPEVVMGAVPTKQADTWALGCLAYQCLTGRPPFFEGDDEATRQTIVSFDLHQDAAATADPLFAGKHAESIEGAARTMIKACLKRDYMQRPLMEDVARMSFFADAGIDVFSLHEQPAHPLDVGGNAPAPDAQWSRRQFSSIWAPQPVAYDISLPDDTIQLSFVRRADETLPIVEGDEAVGFFSASGQGPQALGKITERLPPSNA